MKFLLLAFLSSVIINGGWLFTPDRTADETHGTEYFTYIAKARSADHNTGPAMPDYDDSGWERVTLPHDWVVDLPFSSDASHSHGYKQVGWKFPQNCIGWYRKHLDIPVEDKGKRIWIEFDGIYRASQVFCNGFYLGGRDDGYLQQVYDLTDYLDFGSDNVISVRCDATLEEGWYYEGAGIYRNVHLIVTPSEAAMPHGVKTVQRYEDGHYCLDVSVETTSSGLQVTNTLLDADGREVAENESVSDGRNLAFGKALCISDAREWSMDEPYLYTLRTVVARRDTVLTRIGLRRIEFNSQDGFLLNGEKVILKGCNLHQDHAGVGSGIPDGLWRYRLARLKEFGFNAIRSSHNPATPALLDLCDEMGFAVIDENREFGTNERQLGNLRDMIRRDINHPSIILWSIGNEEWSLENSPKGTEIARKMCAFAHTQDPSRLCTCGNSGGTELVKGCDVFGYNYIVQNPVERYHTEFPLSPVVGTEETTGSGAHGIIERGWKFYHDNRWTCGVFYWTGFDYRGEPNPMVWPSTGSLFGILDYCGFPKDEAYYLKSWWTDEAVIHVCGETEGKIFVYSNCSEVELFAGRRSLGRKKMPVDGHLVWDVTPSVGCVYTARGIRNGVKISDKWPSAPSKTSRTLSTQPSSPDGQRICVVDISSPRDSLSVSVSGSEIIGWGNGDPEFKEKERPLSGERSAIVVKPFCGRCQVILRLFDAADCDCLVTDL